MNASIGHLRLSLSYFVIVALYGVVLRLFPLLESFPLQYRHLIHAHSHLAMLGWVFNALFIVISLTFLSRPAKGMDRLFIAFQVAVWGMTMAFTLQGYGAVSIAFSTLHILLSYVFVYRVNRQSKPDNGNPAQLMLKYALFFLVISTLGPWALAVVSANGLSDTPLYKASIYWFLHFTYNGWMSLALLAVFIRTKPELQRPSTPLMTHVLALSVAGTYALSLLEFDPGYIWNASGALFAIMQIVALVYLLGPAINLRQLDPIKALLILALAMLMLKSVLQVLSALPAVQTLAYFNRDVLIMYLHLVMLGWVGFACLAFLMRNFPPLHRKIAFTGIGALVTGFIVQEMVLAGKALVPEALADLNSIVLLACALCMFIGTALLLASYLGKKVRGLLPVGV